jgi:hypothetical protein
VKRARRQTVARGLSGRQRRRLRKLLAKERVHARGPMIRDAHRLVRAGLAVVTSWKWRPWLRRSMAEVTVAIVRRA